MEETLGKRIASNRKRLALTQDALAEKLGVTAQAVSKWENDQSCPDITMLPKLAEIFEVTTDELLGIPQKQPPVLPDPLHAEEVPEHEDTSESKDAWSASFTLGTSFSFWLILTGVICVIQHLKGISVSFWDVAIISGIVIFGLVGFCRKLSILRLGCAIGGALFLAEMILGTDYLGLYVDWTLPFAIGLVLLGLDLLADALLKPKHSRSPDIDHGIKGCQKNEFSYHGEHFSCCTSFGSNQIPVQLPRLSGGSAEVAFGSIVVDLTSCEDLAVPCNVGLDCAFGELTVLVPKAYRTELIRSAAFGNVEEIGTCDPAAEKVLTLSCDVSFGHIIIRYL